MKILKEEFLKKDVEAKETVLNEVDILKKLNHPNIIKIIEYGDNGYVYKPNGKEL